MSLKVLLNKIIQEKGYLSYDEMVQICRSQNRKPSNGERRLRKSDSPSVEPVFTEKGAIKGYKWIAPKETKETIPYPQVPEQYRKETINTLF